MKKQKKSMFTIILVHLTMKEGDHLTNNGRETMLRKRCLSVVCLFYGVAWACVLGYSKIFGGSGKADKVKVSKGM